MELEPDRWYPATELFDGGQDRLADGSTLWRSTARFLGGTLSALTGVCVDYRRRSPGEPAPRRPYLHCSLGRIEPTHVEGFPGLSSISRQLLREQLLLLRDAGCAFDLAVRGQEVTCVSKGAVCVELVLGAGRQPSADLTRKRNNVQTAFERGLLDEFTSSRADFRLYIKPLTQKLAALQDSQYLPDDAWRVDLLFAEWLSHPDGVALLSPQRTEEESRDAWKSLAFQFRGSSREREFRVADLFARR
jgi:hypothetical protein